jgi:hypothetical protein
MTITAKIKWALPPEGDTLCRTCRYAHIQRGFRESEEAILCCFLAPPVRSVPFKVAECSNFADRTVPTRWEMESMALAISVPRARKPTGFRSATGFAPDEKDEAEEESEPSME